MKTLSIRQPFASLIVHGIKPVENRAWSRLPKWEPAWLAIHSSQKPEGNAKQFMLENYKIDDCVCGSIIGAAFCYAIVGRKDVPKIIRKSEFFNPDCSAWLLFGQSLQIEPVSCKGRLGFWECPMEAIKRMTLEVKR